MKTHSALRVQAQRPDVDAREDVLDQRDLLDVDAQELILREVGQRQQGAAGCGGLRKKSCGHGVSFH
jgi:hypothetical protein